MRKSPSKQVLNEINKLFELAKDESKKRPNLSKRYIKLAREIAKRNNISLKQYKKKFCKNCNNFFISRNCKIRLSKGKISIKCLECQSYRRFGYKKERSVEYYMAL